MRSTIAELFNNLDAKNVWVRYYGTIDTGISKYSWGNPKRLQRSLPKSWERGKGGSILVCKNSLCKWSIKQQQGRSREWDYLDRQGLGNEGVATSTNRPVVFKRNQWIPKLPWWGPRGDRVDGAAGQASQSKMVPFDIEWIQATFWLKITAESNGLYKGMLFRFSQELN